ncbi:hypothetical protein [Yoonia sp. SDW83-1]|uniref:hypothetical protein n=1 Tax=Yoonia sp. SDW83-1 TaxID=3366945 RepID=UPI00398C6FAA
MQVSSTLVGMSKRGLAFGLAGVFSACTVAPEECAKADNHFFDAPPEDLGNGLVLNKSGSSHGNSRYRVASSFRSVVDCETGIASTFVLLDVFEKTERVDGRPYATSFSSDGPSIDAGEAGKEFEAFLDAGGYTSLAEVKAKAEELGIVVRERISEQEDCGCAVFYPGMLGDKEPAQERNA